MVNQTASDSTTETSLLDWFDALLEEHEQEQLTDHEKETISTW